MSEPLSVFVQYGGLGAILVIALLALRVLYNERNAESAARIQDAKDYAALLLKTQQATTEAINKLYELFKASKGDR